MHPIEQKLKIITDDFKKENIQGLVIRNYLKEYLQDVLLYVIYNHPKLKELIFYGGSCLRKVYDLNRVSEDLDFETIKPINLNLFKKILIDYFKQQKFDHPNISIQSSKNISRLTVKFPILYNLHLSSYPDEKLHLKIEIRKINKKYPTNLTPYTKDHYSILLKHYDLPTLMAGKITACLARIFKKGSSGIEIKARDFYDLVWYMQKRVEPNIKFLRDLKIGNTRQIIFGKLDDKISKIKSKDLLIDLEPLFKDRIFIKDWCQNFQQIYNSARSYYN